MQDKYRGDQDLNYVRNPGRSLFLRRSAQVAGAMATIAGVYEFFTQVLPWAGRILESVQPSTKTDGNASVSNATVISQGEASPSSDWINQPEVLRVTSDNLGYPLVLPPGSIVATKFLDDFSGSTIWNLRISDPSRRDSVTTHDYSWIAPDFITVQVYRPNASSLDVWKDVENKLEDEFTSAAQSSQSKTCAIYVYQENYNSQNDNGTYSLVEAIGSSGGPFAPLS